MGVTVRQDIDSQIQWYRNQDYEPNLIELNQKAYEELTRDTSFMVHTGANLTTYQGIPVATAILCQSVVVHAYTHTNPIWGVQDVPVFRLPLSVTEQKIWEAYAEAVRKIVFDSIAKAADNGQV